MMNPSMQPPRSPQTNRAGATPQSAERRRHQRIQYETEVTFSSQNNFFTGFTEDVSEGGLFLATYELAPIGTVIDLRFTLPDERVVEVVGDVRWVRDPRQEEPGAPPGMGVQFRALDEQDRRALAEFTAAREPLFYED